MDWYYERAVVTALYSATELFLLTDQSQNFVETRAFLDKSLDHYRTARKSPFAIKDALWRMVVGSK
eukprot:gene3846-2730_t